MVLSEIRPESAFFRGKRPLPETFSGEFGIHQRKSLGSAPKVGFSGVCGKSALKSSEKSARIDFFPLRVTFFL
jgi:hypothetical protein